MTASGPTRAGTVSDHLNSKNPFTGQQIPEPGRVFFGKLSWSF